jgi:S-adenosylmethionine:tRNA ribosyltransferase-isomerase
MRAEDFFYPLPDDAIAQTAIEPRHQARLLDTRDMSDHRFIDLPDLLIPGDLVVVNNTRVRRARLRGRKRATGGVVEMLVLKRLEGRTWEVVIRPARRLRPGSTIRFAEHTATIISGPVEGVVAVEFDSTEVESLMEEAGEVPLPPYFTGFLDDPERYQTMFARHPGSAAAPTAALHFTPDVVSRLEDRSIRVAEVELHVGVDTFRPMTTGEVEDHQMHSEWCSVPPATANLISETRYRAGRVVAVGTTTVRALETFGRPDGKVDSGETDTRLFIMPGSRFQVVDLMVTNFHIPGSTLLVLVAAFLGDRWRDAYRHALEGGYRFLSFGDAMLCARGGGPT